MQLELMSPPLAHVFPSQPFTSMQTPSLSWRPGEHAHVCPVSFAGMSWHFARESPDSLQVSRSPAHPSISVHVPSLNSYPAVQAQSCPIPGATLSWHSDSASPELWHVFISPLHPSMSTQVWMLIPVSFFSYPWVQSHVFPVSGGPRLLHRALVSPVEAHVLPCAQSLWQLSTSLHDSPTNSYPAVQTHEKPTSGAALSAHVAFVSPFSAQFTPSQPSLSMQLPSEKWKLSEEHVQVYASLSAPGTS